MPCGKLWYQVKQAEDAMNVLKKAGISIGNPAYNAIYKLRGEMMGKLGLKTPRGIVGVLKLVGLSPGIIRVWFDAEAGWMSEARATPGGPPVYRYIDAATAILIIKGGLTHELEERLMTPDTYAGE